MRVGGRFREPLALFALVTIIYGNSLDGQFQYDDYHSIVHNPHVREAANATAFFIDTEMFSVDADKAMYRPLLLLSFAVNYAIHGYEVAGYRVVNISLHYLCALLVWGIATRLGYSPTVAFVVAAIFSAHPLATEPVNYISSRSELMGACFFLAAFRAFMETSRGFTVMAVLLFAGGLLSKSVVIVLPVVLLLYDVWIRGERPVVARHLPFWVTASIYLSILLWTRFLEASLQHSPRSLDVQLYTQLKAVLFYLKLLFIPVGLNVEHQFLEAHGPFQPVVVLGALITLSSAILAWRALPRRYLFWLCWIGAALAPATLTPLNVLVNEHRMYLSIAGLSLMGGAGAPLFSGGLVRPLAVLLLLTASLSVVKRNEVWADEMSLWADSAAKSPHMVRPFVHLGNAYRRDGQSVPARIAYTRAVAIDPLHRAANTNLANLHLESGFSESDSIAAFRYFEAAASGYRAVLDRDPTYREALGNLAVATMELGRLEEAEGVYLQVIREHPHFADGFFNLGKLYMRLNRYVDADSMFGRALLLDPSPETHHEQGISRVRQGRLLSAADSFRAAWSGENDSNIYAENLSRVLVALGERAFAEGDTSSGVALWLEAESCLEKVVSLTSSGGALRSLRDLKQRAEQLSASGQ